MLWVIAWTKNAWQPPSVLYLEDTRGLCVVSPSHLARTAPNSPLSTHCSSPHDWTTSGSSRSMCMGEFRRLCYCYASNLSSKSAAYTGTFLWASSPMEFLSPQRIVARSSSHASSSLLLPTSISWRAVSMLSCPDALSWRAYYCTGSPVVAVSKSALQPFGA